LGRGKIMLADGGADTIAAGIAPAADDHDLIGGENSLVRREFGLAGHARLHRSVLHDVQPSWRNVIVEMPPHTSE
jgi:hypothetical protein